MRRTTPALFVLSVALASFAVAPSACSSTPTAASPEVDAGGVDVPDFEEPAFDADDPAGRVLVLPIYFPDKRCFEPPTEIGKFQAGPDGKIKDCAKQEVCYVRPDGVLAYHDQDCIAPGDFRANWRRLDYSDLGPCEPIKHAFAQVKACPNASCTWARDAVIDTTASCATALTTKGCRDALGPPSRCWCNGASVFVPADSKSTAAPPPSYAPCDGTPECKKALGLVDAVRGCEAIAPVDAGAGSAGDAGIGDAAGD
jgi:hypothetical protein